MLEHALLASLNQLFYAATPICNGSVDIEDYTNSIPDMSSSRFYPC